MIPNKSKWRVNKQNSKKILTYQNKMKKTKILTLFQKKTRKEKAILKFYWINLVKKIQMNL